MSEERAPGAGWRPPVRFVVVRRIGHGPRRADRASRTFRLEAGEWCLVVLTSPAGFFV